MTDPISWAYVATARRITWNVTSGVLGVTGFVKTDTGFTPNGLIIHTATLPDKSQSVSQTYADANRRYQYTRTYSTLTGTYSQADTDGTSGQTAPPMSWTVSAAVINDFSLQVSPSAQSVNQGGSVTYTYDLGFNPLGPRLLDAQTP